MNLPEISKMAHDAGIRIPLCALNRIDGLRKGSNLVDLDQN